mmetsp:Transcript_101093/g.326293  ORF Transcript_101093/g.326293 Transcript_101093/m.326293 type:complete len:207 (+) Transcript_101093:902-1522(+)
MPRLALDAGGRALGPPAPGLPHRLRPLRRNAELPGQPHGALRRGEPRRPRGAGACRVPAWPRAAGRAQAERGDARQARAGHPRHRPELRRPRAAARRRPGRGRGPGRAQEAAACHGAAAPAAPGLPQHEVQRVAARGRRQAGQGAEVPLQLRALDGEVQEPAARAPRAAQRARRRARVTPPRPAKASELPELGTRRAHRRRQWQWQ